MSDYYKIDTYLGIPYRITEPKLKGEDSNHRTPRYRCSLSLYNPETKVRIGKSVDGLGPTTEAALSNAETKIPALIKSCTDTLVSLAKDGTMPFTAAGFYTAFEEEIYLHLTINVARGICRKLWMSPKVQKQYGSTYLLDGLLSDKQHLTVLRGLFRRKASEDALTEEKVICAILQAIYDSAIQKGIIMTNPFWQQAKKYADSLNTTILARLSRQNASFEEHVAIIKESLDLFEKTKRDVFLAVAVRSLLGCTIYELLALDRADLRYSEQHEVSWYPICKYYYQSKETEKAEMRYRLRTIYAYRCLVCTQCILDLVRPLFERETEEPALFQGANGRLTPNEYRVEEKRILDKTLAHIRGPELSTRKKFGAGDDRTITNGDFLRSNISFYLRHACDFTDSETSAFLGRAASETFAKTYAHWSNVLVMKQMRARLERWHNRLMTAVLDDTVQVKERTYGYVLTYRTDGTECPMISISTKYGANAEITCAKREDDYESQ